jgi:orc1/cdc6 family replication initiation protein
VTALPDAGPTPDRDSVFADKALLDPARACGPTIGRETQARELANLLGDARTGYIPAFIELHGPPGTGKTTTVTEVAKAVTAKSDGLKTVFVNLKECRSLFSAANQILFELTGTKEPQVVGLDGVFAKLWSSVRKYKLLILILDEIDAIFEEKRYRPSDFVYRFLRRRETAETPLVCLITLANRLMGIESLLESRVRSRMGTRAVHFPPYREEELLAILEARRGAFRPDGLALGVLERCARHAAEEHGDARRALDLLRVAGEKADEAGAPCVEIDHVMQAIRALDREGVEPVIRKLPGQERLVLVALCDAADELFAKMTRWKDLKEAAEKDSSGWRNETPPENPAIPVSMVMDRYIQLGLEHGLEPRSRRRFLDFVDSLEMHGLVGSDVRSTGRYGHEKRIWIEGDPVQIGHYARHYLEQRSQPGSRGAGEPSPDNLR